MFSEHTTYVQSVRAQITADVDIVRPEQHLGAPEPLGARRNQLPVQQFVVLRQIRGRVRLDQHDLVVLGHIRCPLHRVRQRIALVNGHRRRRPRRAQARRSARRVEREHCLNANVYIIHVIFSRLDAQLIVKSVVHDLLQIVSVDDEWMWWVVCAPLVCRVSSFGRVVGGAMKSWSRAMVEEE